MPQIEGLKEQQEALKRVKNNLKEVEDINSFLKGVSALPVDEGCDISYVITVTATNQDTLKRHRCPLLLSDNRYILEAALKYKESIVKKVRQDSDDYRITLSPKDNATLDWKPFSE